MIRILFFRRYCCMFTCVLRQNKFVIVFVQWTFFTWFCRYLYFNVREIILIIFAFFKLLNTLLNTHFAIFQIQKQLIIVIRWLWYHIQIRIIIEIIALNLIFYLWRCINPWRFFFWIRILLTKFWLSLVFRLSRVQ